MRHLFWNTTVAMILTSTTLATARPSQPVLSPDTGFVETFCKAVESYQPGSNHYFTCLNTGHELSAQGATGQQLVEGICESLADLFYDSSSLGRCYQDGSQLLGE